MRSNNPIPKDTIRELCPAVFQDAPHPDRSDKYVYISTETVLDAMLEAGFGVSRAQQTRARSAEAAGFARHLLSFRPLRSFNVAKVGDAIPEVVLLNSHDGNCAYRLHVGIFRLVCENGMVAGRNFESIQIRHRGTPALEVVEQTHHIFDNYVPRLQNWVGLAQDFKLTPRQQNQFAREAQLIRYDKDAFDPKELLVVRRDEDEGDSLWHVYNRVQENLMRGGIEFKNANGRQCETKPINRVTKDVIYNQKLWDLASDLLPEAA